MKFLNLGILIAALVLSTTSHGKICEAGRLSDENYIKINFGKNSTDFDVYEGSFSVSAKNQKSDLKKRYVLIPNQKASYESEGEMMSSKVFSLVMFTGQNAIVYLEIDGSVQQDNRILKCR